MTETLTNLWEEKNSIDHKMNLTKNEENVRCVTTEEIKKDSIKKDWSITTKLILIKMNPIEPFSKPCPNCGNIISYKWKCTLTNSLKFGLICKGCTTKEHGGYSKLEEDILINNYSALGTAGCVKLLPHRSYGSIRMKANKLGLKLIRRIPSDLIKNKICGCCKVEMNKTYFGNNKNRKDGKHPTCKLCSKQQSSSHLRKENRKVWSKLYRKNKLDTDVNYKLKHKLRKRFKSHLKSKGLRKSESVLRLLGCNIKQFRRHIESQFKIGMSWDNYSYWGWHIDHILPCASFDFTKEEERRKCWHYTNLQPLWMEDNLRKWSKTL